MTNHSALSEKSRLAALATVVGILIVAAVVAIVVVTTGSGPSGADTPGQAGRKASTPAASGTVTVDPASPSASATPSATRSSSKPSTSPVAEKSSLPKKTRKPITYTVKPGDNLTVIAAWFKLHGYGNLYERNKSVIGKNPDLIRPGQKITVSGRGMTVSTDK